MVIDDDEFQRPYKRIAAAEELVDANSILDCYITAYKKKFRNEPIFPKSNAHLTQIKDLKSQTKGRGYEFIQAYFQMKEWVFEQQHYSLDCLLKNLNKVSTYLATRAPQTKAGTKTVAFDGYCDFCWGRMTVEDEISPTAFSGTMKCEQCIKENGPVKKIPHTRRLEVNLPELPKDATSSDT